MDSSDVSQFSWKLGMVSGSKSYYDLKLVRTTDQDKFAERKALNRQTGQTPKANFRVYEPSGITIANCIADLQETKWLVREMTRALGKR